MSSSSLSPLVRDSGSIKKSREYKCTEKVWSVFMDYKQKVIITVTCLLLSVYLRESSTKYVTITPLIVQSESALLAKYVYTQGN